MDQGGETANTTLKVLLIEDDQAVGETLIRALERAGMQTAWAMTGVQALALKSSFKPDVALVDLNLPDTDGMNLVTVLARQGGCGIIIVSGLSDEADRIVGLEIGADDYISKPPQLREMVARIRAVHRRMKMPTPTNVGPKSPTIIQFGRVRINLMRRAIEAPNGDHIALTAAEFKALETMLEANGEAVSRDRLSQAALRRPWRADDRSVDQLIFNLRNKLAECDNQPIIHSIRGAGYLLLANRPNDVPYEMVKAELP